jgi:hypothetical protein
MKKIFTNNINEKIYTKIAAERRHVWTGAGYATRVAARTLM